MCLWLALCSGMCKAFETMVMDFFLSVFECVLLRQYEANTFTFHTNTCRACSEHSNFSHWVLMRFNYEEIDLPTVQLSCGWCIGFNRNENDHRLGVFIVIFFSWTQSNRNIGCIAKTIEKQKIERNVIVDIIDLSESQLRKYVVCNTRSSVNTKRIVALQSSIFLSPP